MSAFPTAFFGVTFSALFEDDNGVVVNVVVVVAVVFVVVVVFVDDVRP